MLGQFRDARRTSSSSTRCREPPSRLLEREGHARGDSQGHQQGVSVRRRARAAWACRPTATSRCATASPARTRTSSAPCATASIARCRSTSSSKHHIADKTDCSTMLGAAAVLGRLLSRGAHALRLDTVEPNLHYCEWIRGWTKRVSSNLRRAFRAKPGISRESIGKRRKPRQDRHPSARVYARARGLRARPWGWGPRARG